MCIYIYIYVYTYIYIYIYIYAIYIHSDIHISVYALAKRFIRLWDQLELSLLGFYGEPSIFFRTIIHMICLLLSEIYMNKSEIKIQR